MADRTDLKEWVYEAVQKKGRTQVVNVARSIWEQHEQELRESGDLFYTWQYQMRWAAQQLRKEGRLMLAGRDWALKR